MLLILIMTAAVWAMDPTISPPEDGKFFYVDFDVDAEKSFHSINLVTNSGGSSGKFGSSGTS